MAVSISGILATITLLLVVVRGKTPSCPNFCKCPVKYRADCLNLSLTRVPANLHSEIKFLNFSNNHLGMISKSVLDSNIQHLKILDLSYNKIAIIHSGAIEDLKELIFLYLSGNEITNMVQDVFQYNTRLEFLKLDKNVLIIPSNRPFLNIPSLKSLNMAACNIKIIPEITFAKLENLCELNLSHNRLLNLESGVFLPLKYLKTLYLSNNLLRELPQDVFVSLKTLEVLDLSRNQLQTLNSQVFAFLENVDLLDLSYNKFKTLNPEVFAQMTRLKTLHLHKNILNYITENHFSKLNNLSLLDLSGNDLYDFNFRIICRLDNLSYLKISENRFSCDCTLWQLWRWSADKNITFLSTCEEPRFESSVVGFEELRRNKSCNATMCELKMDIEIPEELFKPIYIYIMVGFGFLVVIAATCLTVWAVIRYRKQICRKNHTVVATEHSVNTMTYISRPRAEQLDQISREYVQRQLDLQHELHRRHQEALMRGRLHRQLSSSLRSLSERDSTYQNIRHSYHEQRLPSVADDESAWFNADTLPSNNRTYVPSPSVRNSDSRRDRSASEPKLKEHPKLGSNIVDEGGANAPKYDSSVLCPLPRRARRSLVLEFSPRTDEVPEENVETNRL
ncbi:hypothetical protein L9F63_025737 [Diploptera punctata]|uniref:Uncharacterized protein n=1 Tax=Diploptera punctata TaxID=6984 RepID=A0AAD7Z820_DIPPU|nr:hypothetical protein L9F63_025737 [Diploptera punctata]